LHLYPKIANSRIENNLIYGNDRWGIGLYSKPGVGSNKIVNNTIVQNGSGITVKNGHGEIIANNIIVDNTGWKFEKAEPIEDLDVPPKGRFSQSRASLWQSKDKLIIEYNLFLPPYRGAGPHAICFPYEPSLLLPEARKSWYYQWPFLFKGHSETIPDFWKLPKLDTRLKTKDPRQKVDDR